MLQVAARHQVALAAAVQVTLDDPRCNYYWNEYPTTTGFKLPDNEWTSIDNVSVVGSALHGYLAATIDRSTRTVDSLGIISFRPGSIVFARDLQTFFAKLILGGWERIGWTVTLGNPAELMYDRLCDRLGGRIVGTQRLLTRSRITGQLLDRKLYEVIPSEIPQSVLDEVWRLNPNGGSRGFVANSGRRQ